MLLFKSLSFDWANSQSQHELFNSNIQFNLYYSYKPQQVQMSVIYPHLTRGHWPGLTRFKRRHRVNWALKSLKCRLDIWLIKRKNLKKRGRFILFVFISHWIFSVSSANGCSSRVVSLSLSSLNDVVYTHLTINMQPRGRGRKKKGTGKKKKTKGRKAWWESLGTVNTAWINLSEVWQRGTREESQRGTGRGGERHRRQRRREQRTLLLGCVLSTLGRRSCRWLHVPAVAGTLTHAHVCIGGVQCQSSWFLIKSCCARLAIVAKRGNHYQTLIFIWMSSFN